jgi:hypothetical protein
LSRWKIFIFFWLPISIHPFILSFGKQSCHFQLALSQMLNLKNCYICQSPITDLKHCWNHLSTLSQRIFYLIFFNVLYCISGFHQRPDYIMWTILIWRLNKGSSNYLLMNQRNMFIEVHQNHKDLETILSFCKKGRFCKIFVGILATNAKLFKLDW